VQRSGYCATHLAYTRATYDRTRDKAARSLYGARWRKARLLYLQQHPLCVQCQAQGRVTLAGVVDHIRDHDGDQARFWSESNWQSLCKPCHDAKTARTVGFGRKIARNDSAFHDVK
jgi:5-methylcytosine-specific restriction protein A